MRDCLDKIEVYRDKWSSCVIRWCGPALECNGKGAPSHTPPQFVTLAHKGYRTLTWLTIANYRAGINTTARLAPDTAWFLHLQEGWINSSSQQHHCHNKLALPREVTGRITSILQRLTKWFNPAASLGSVSAQQWLTINALMRLMCWKTLWKSPLGKSCNSPAAARLHGLEEQLCIWPSASSLPRGAVPYLPWWLWLLTLMEEFDTFPLFCKGQLTHARGNTLLSQWLKTKQKK